MIKLPMIVKSQKGSGATQSTVVLYSNGPSEYSDCSYPCMSGVHFVLLLVFSLLLAFCVDDCSQSVTMLPGVAQTIRTGTGSVSSRRRMPFCSLQRLSWRRTPKKRRSPSPSFLGGSRRFREGPPRVPMRSPNDLAPLPSVAVAKGSYAACTSSPLGNSSAARAPPPQEAAEAPSTCSPTSRHLSSLANPPWPAQQGKKGLPREGDRRPASSPEPAREEAAPPWILRRLGSRRRALRLRTSPTCASAAYQERGGRAPPAPPAATDRRRRIPTHTCGPCSSLAAAKATPAPP
jgi:hypothetical protein